jgi:Domain of unknown function (DUF4279)
MKSFRTLRAFVEGTEPDEPNYYAYSASLRIFGDALDFDEITRTLRIEPTGTYRKGTRKGQRSPPYSHDMWTLSPNLPEERPLAEHIDALWAAIRHGEDYLRELKTIATVDVFLGYRSNIDTAGVEIPHRCLEMFVRLEIPLELSIVIA